MYEILTVISVIFSKYRFGGDRFRRRNESCSYWACKAEFFISKSKKIWLSVVLKQFNDCSRAFSRNFLSTLYRLLFQILEAPAACFSAWISWCLSVLAQNFWDVSRSLVSVFMDFLLKKFFTVAWICGNWQTVWTNLYNFFKIGINFKVNFFDFATWYRYLTYISNTF